MKKSSKSKSKSIKNKSYGIAATVVGAIFVVMFAVLAVNKSNEPIDSDTPFREGEHYTKLNQPVQAVELNNITELFWYGCPHCLSVEPLASAIKSTSAKNGWEFEQIHHPATNGVWRFDFNVYAALKQLGVDGTVGKEYMKAVQRPMNMNRADIDTFLNARNIDVAEFKILMENDARDELNRKANSFISKQVSGTPKFVVSGKYLINDLNYAIPIIEYLMKEQP